MLQCKIQLFIHHYWDGPNSCLLHPDDWEIDFYFISFHIFCSMRTTTVNAEKTQSTSSHPSKPYAEASGLRTNWHLQQWKWGSITQKGLNLTSWLNLNWYFGPNMLLWHLFFFTVKPCGLCKPPHAASWSNLGQALSMLIKKGIFFLFVIYRGRSLGIRGGRNRS